ncbi:MAG: glycosyltransferase family 2 protein [Candidatus Limnocylindrales bacterium]
MVTPRTPPAAPPAVEVLAHRRAEARAARDWLAADSLRAEIEAAGWKVIDQGLRFRLEPIHPPDVLEARRVRYGSSGAVPSCLDEPPTALASVVVLADRWPDDLARALDGLRAHASAGTQVVVVANDPTPEQADQLEDPTGPVTGSIAGALPEQVWTSAPIGHAAALNAGIRRAVGGSVILLDSSVEPTGDFVTPLLEALEDPSVAVAGGWGLRSGDLRHFEAAGAGDVDVIEGAVLAFRRSDYARRGPLDERFRFYRHLDIWWSLMLRDAGDGGPHRRALQLDLPAIRHPQRGDTSLPEPERDRLSRRNFYRIIDRFGGRRDLLIAPDARLPGSHPAG